MLLLVARLADFVAVHNDRSSDKIRLSRVILLMDPRRRECCWQIDRIEFYYRHNGRCICMDQNLLPWDHWAFSILSSCFRYSVYKSCCIFILIIIPLRIRLDWIVIYREFIRANRHQTFRVTNCSARLTDQVQKKSSERLNTVGVCRWETYVAAEYFSPHATCSRAPLHYRDRRPDIGRTTSKFFFLPLRLFQESFSLVQLSRAR